MLNINKKRLYIRVIYYNFIEVIQILKKYENNFFY